MSSSRHLLVRAALGEAVERVPVWAMRQAGRWDPEFQKIRVGSTFYEFSENVEKAAAASLCPKRFGVDAIILFYDITTLPLAMGLPFELKKDIGPCPDRPIRTPDDLNRLNPEPTPDSFGHIRALLKRVKEELRDELPVIVFAGAPFTVATYCIGTGKDLEATRRFAAESPSVWMELLHRLEHATVIFLKQLIADGADLYQLFDSWAGMLSKSEYDQWAQPFHGKIFASATGVPRILFVKECPHLVHMVESGAEVVSLGVCHNLSQTRAAYPNIVFQGNVDEEVLRGGTLEQVNVAVRECLRAGGGMNHILNLNHGVDKETPPDNFAAYIRAAKEALR